MDSETSEIPENMTMITEDSLISDTEFQMPLKYAAEEKESPPPEGGWGWVVCFTSMVCNGIVFSIMNTFGILYTFLLLEYANDDPLLSVKTSFVGSFSVSLTFLMNIVSSILSDKFGIRPTAFVGALLGLCGLIASSFISQLELLYLTFGVLLGLGGGLITVPSLTILGHYFKKRMGLANGMVTFGSSLFSIVLSITLPVLLNAIKVKYTFLVLAAMYFLAVFCILTWKPRRPVSSNRPAERSAATPSCCCLMIRNVINTSIFQNKAYVLWIISFCIALFGYFGPTVHLVKYANDMFPTDNGSVLITCTQITSAISRLIVGLIADVRCVNRILLQQIAFVVMGVLVTCIPLAGSFMGLIVISLFLGVSDGVMVCLVGPIAFDIVGDHSASQAIGFLFGINAIPFLSGPPAIGFLYDRMGSYKVAFHLSGAPPIIGAIIMFLIPKIKKHRQTPEIEVMVSSTLLIDNHTNHTIREETAEETELEVLCRANSFTEENTIIE